jgi:heat shock protein HslJ
MHRRLAAAALLLTLTLPATALAADPSPVAPAPPPMGGAWQIVAIETPAGSVKVDGKLAIGTDLSASLGCNSMSATVASFDGAELVIGPIATTEIGCPADLATAETYLAAVLGAGRLTFDGSSLASSGGRITFASNQPAEPITTPPPADGTTIDPTTCAALLGPDWNVGGGMTPGSGGGSGSGSSSSGSAGAGTTSTGGTVDPGTGSGGLDQGTGGVVAEPPSAIGSAVPVEPPMPPVSASADPGPQTEPGATALPGATTPDASPPDAGTVPAPSGAPIATDGVVDVVPVPPGDVVPGPVVGPDASMSPEEACRALLASMTGSKGTPVAGAADGAIPPGTAQDAEHAPALAPTASTEPVNGIVVLGLGVLVAGLVAFGLFRRDRSRRGADAEPPAGEG